MNSSFVEMNRQELDECNGGLIGAVLILGGVFVGGVVVGAGATIGVIKFCQWLGL